jgi:outer membrane protein assembly factor BamB
VDSGAASVRSSGLAALVVTFAVALGGCALRTTGATDFSTNFRTGEVTFTLHAVGECDNTCTAFVRWRPLGTSTWTNEAAQTFTQGPGRLDQRVTTTVVAERYEYQVCGKQSGWQSFVCAGPNGKPDLTEEFAQPPADDWPQWRFDDDNTAANPGSLVIDAGSAQRLVERWRARLRRAGSAVVSNGVLYVASAGPGAVGGRLTAYPAECETGRRQCTTTLWSSPVTGDVSGATPAVFGGVVYLASNVEGASGTTTGRLHAFDASSGTLRFTADTGGAIRAVPHVGAGIVVVSSDDGRLHAFTGCGPPASGSCPPFWVSGSFMAAGAAEVTSSPAGPTGVPPVEFSFFVGSPDGHLYAFQQFSGAFQWRGATGGAVHSSPAIANDVVYVGADNGTLSAFFTQGCGGPSECNPLWTFATGGPITAAPALDDRFFPTTVYAGSRDGKLYALSASCGVCTGGGGLLWTADTGAPIISSPIVAGHLLYVPSGRRVHVFRADGCGASTCAPLVTLRGAGQVSTPSVANGELFFTDRSRLHAYGKG